ncbi:flagellar assembly protein A [Duganella aceris]|uniref:flagellar assembly protein A n=1 Tax=Duganella aceris TaxID=2703883 RepID=UPI003530A6E0
MVDDVAPAELPIGLLKRADGIYIDLGMAKPALIAAVGHVFQSGYYFTGLNYPVLIKALYDVGPELGAVEALRLAGDVRLFDAARRALYKNPKMGSGYAEYYFELLYIEETTLPDGTVIPERQTRLDIDEFVADMWNKGIHFGIDVAAVSTAIAAAKPDRITFASDLEPEPGQDATVVEVASELHRSDAPKARADGRVDLQSFENRFPQIKENMRLLKKQPAVPGLPGFDLSGRMTAPQPPKDLTLRFYAGDGTEARELEDGEYLVSTREGFLSVDAKSSRISITDKIVSTEGVSGRTTGNLELAGAYEEYGDVQEQRDVTGSDITVHGNVYGNITSRGGTVVLDRNLVSGSITNADGSISIAGVASNSVIHTGKGRITITRAENCVISGGSVKIEEASNCEIIADEIVISVAEGCAVAGRNVDIESAGPRRRTEMIIYVLVKDVAQFDQEIADLDVRLAAFDQSNQACVAEMERIAALPDVRRYLALAAKLRTQELTLTAEQGQVLRKIAGAVASDLQAINKLKLELQAGHTQHKLLSDRLARVIEQKVEAAGIARCGLHMVSGETLVRTMLFGADTTALTQLPPKDIKQRLRGTPSGGELLFAESAGSLDWHLNSRLRPAPV